MGVREKWDSKETLSGSLNHSLRTWKEKNIKQRKMGTGFWFFLFLTNLLLGQRSVNVIEREEREILVWFSFHAYNYLGKPPFTFFLFLAIPFSLGKSCVTGQCNRQLFGSAFVNCQQPFFKTFLKLLSFSLSLLCLLLILCICIWGESINTKNDKPIGH